eukprot:g913.t1
MFTVGLTSNLRERTEARGENYQSAYSVFNEGFRGILGSHFWSQEFTDNQLRNRPLDFQSTATNRSGSIGSSTGSNPWDQRGDPLHPEPHSRVLDDYDEDMQLQQAIQRSLQER